MFSELSRVREIARASRLLEKSVALDQALEVEKEQDREEAGTGDRGSGKTADRSVR